MKRLVILLALLAMIFPSSAAARGSDSTPEATPQGTPDVDGPQFSDDAWDFTIAAVLVGTEFGEPLNWGPNEDGRQFVLVQIRVRNNNTEDNQVIRSSQFGIVDGDEVVPANDDLSKRPEQLGIRPMGEDNGTELVPLETEDFILAWRVSPQLNEFVLDVDLTNESDDDRIDLSEWVERDIAPSDLVPTRVLPTAPATRTPVPTSTSVPTNTPRPPTATATLSPNDITPSEQEYIDAVGIDALILGGASTELGELFSAAGSDSSLIFDSDWKDDVDNQLDIFRGVYDRALELQPSSRQSGIHSIWLELTAYAADAANSYTLGIELVDVASLEAGNISLQNATDLTDDLVDAINAFEDDPASFGGGGGSTGGDSTTVQQQADAIDGPVADCSSFASYAVAQAYYASNPEEQPVIDPDNDGLACEVYFGQG